MSVRSLTHFFCVALLISASAAAFSQPALALFEKKHVKNQTTGCNAPKYKQFVKERLVYFEQKNKRLLNSTFRDYEQSSQTNSNPYKVIGDLSRHLIYSAQLEPVQIVNAKINLMFQHGERLSRDQQIAGNVFDNFSKEAHFVGIARAWVAYRQGRNQEAFNELLTSIDVSNSAVLVSFGPDFTFIRRIYRDGHTQPVVAYLNKTKNFWIGKRADALRFAWLTMIEKGCAIQFDSLDTIKFAELGLITK